MSLTNEFGKQTVYIYLCDINKTEKMHIHILECISNFKHKVEQMSSFKGMQLMHLFMELLFKRYPTASYSSHP